MEIEEKRRYAKEELGIAQASNMKESTLDRRIEEAKTPKVDHDEKNVSTLDITLTKEDKAFLDKIGFKGEWLASLANQYGFKRFAYIAKFKAFRCYKEGNNHVDWVSVNDLGLVNVKKELTTILLKHQTLNKNKQVIKLPWR